ncbi:AraC family transcriptional regulator [Pseudanabaena sp. FACHB-2040]|uniref:AraC family transcriptional regulator n=1 Tax=Pseudanabaena sp. FACHB-2040 TaxID=2692859 RepID=UPI00168A382C|nr:AraC family transcriptional regulator [Pseudanabaena sp. FACHB-2040]MBD2258273.1 helix-turn-helix transcriptional regulator [Pseudanabaena sp. FACHB-2040]
MPSETALHPTEIVQPGWVRFSQSLHSGGITLEHQVQPSGECEVSGGSTHHLLIFELGNVSRQIIHMDGQEYDDSLRPGDLILIPAGVPFRCVCDSTDEVVSFNIDPLFLEQLSLTEICSSPAEVELVSTFKQRDRQIDWIVQSIQNEMQTAAWGSRLYLDSLTQLLAVHLLRSYASHPLKLSRSEPGLSVLKLNQVLDYINAHLEQEIQLTDLAQVTSFNLGYFASLFKQSMGMSPWQYIMQQRVERAKQLLKRQDYSIADIAVRCGFSSQSHLTYQFRKLTGVTPNTFRRNH